MNTPKCHACGADLVQIKLSEDSEVGWYCVGCDADLLGEQEEAPTKIEGEQQDSMEDRSGKGWVSHKVAQRISN